MKTKKFICCSLVILFTLTIFPQNVWAFQPASHYILMKETTKNLPENSIVRQSMEKYPLIAAWGANGPDLPLIQPRQLLEFSPWSDRYHYYKVGSLAARQLQEALASNDMKKIAFAAGWVTHVTGDYACHGIFVDPEAGVYLDDPFGRPLHIELEKMAEPYLWVNQGGLSKSDYDDGISDKFSYISDIPFDLLNSASTNIYNQSPDVLDEKSWCAALLTGLKTGIGYSYQDYDTAMGFLSSNNRKERLDAAFLSGMNHAVALLTQAEQGDYSQFSDRWNLDVGRNNCPISSLTVIIHTGNEKRGFLNTEWAGTDDDVSFGIRMKDGTEKEWVLDKKGYNDFEADDKDEYYLYNNTAIHPKDISSIYLKKQERFDSVGGDWFIEEISIDINGHKALEHNIQTWLDEDITTWNTDVDWSTLDLSTDPDPQNP